MLNKLIGFLCILCFALPASGQVNVYNKGGVFITGDTVFMAGSMLNDTTADLRNNGIIKIKGNIYNHQQVFQSSAGTLFLNGPTRQLISGTSPLTSFNLSQENPNGTLLQHHIIIPNDLTIISGSLDADTFSVTCGRNIISANALNIQKGTLILNGSTLQSVPANTFKGNRISDLLIKNDIQLNGADTISNSISFGGSGHELISGGELVLKSDSNGTARIGDITSGGLFNGNEISGLISIERHIPARKAWRLLSAPVNSFGAPTINASWQEGVTGGNPVPGYGVKITGGTSSNGFDQSATNLASIKVYDNVTGTFKALPGIPGTNIPISTYSGYFLYLRGDRSIDLMQGVNAAVTATTLRMKGNINTGNKEVPVNSSGYTVVGNPFASAINFRTLSRNNVRNGFYMWDPALSGAYGLGSYVTFMWNSSTGEYDKTSSASPLSQYIPSGEAFIVQTADGLQAGNITFKESDKTTEGSDDVFGRSNGLAQSVRVDLYSNTDNALLDGVLATFDIDNSNAVDMNDALKLQGTAENIAINRDGQLLSIERRAEVVITDTIPLNMFRMRNRDYKLVIASNNMNVPGLAPMLIDNYSTQGIVNLNPVGTTEVIFNINADPASYSASRFKIVFNTVSVLPVSITSIKASKQQEDVLVTWKTENELNIDHYDIERSADGRAFIKIGSVASQSANNNNHYELTDEEPSKGINYYRVRAVSADGTYSYSSIVHVIFEKEVSAIDVFPNPVPGEIITFRPTNIRRGIYKLSILNNLGQLIFSSPVFYNGSDGEISIRKNLSPGIYTVYFSGNGLKVSEKLLKNN